MKKYLLVLKIFIFSTSFLFGQDKGIRSSYLDNSSSDIIEELVIAAWEHYPENKKYQHEINIAEHNVTQTGLSWMDNIYASGNLNEYTLDPPENFQGNLFFPRYNFGIRINLGTFINVPKEKQIANEELRIAKLNKQQQKNKIRAEVLRKYNLYLMHKEINEVQTQALEDAYSNFAVVKKKFKDGKASIDEYSQAFNNYNDQKIKKINAEADYEIAKINLEELIGMDVEEILDE